MASHQEIAEYEHVYRGDDQQALPRNVCTVTFDLNSNVTTIIERRAHQEITEDEHVYRGDDQQALPRNVHTVTFDLNSNVTTIIERRAHLGSPLTTVTLPNMITRIAKKVYLGCSSLTFVTLPPNITSIGDSTFQDCSSLVSVYLPSNVTSIGDAAFQGCSSLASIELPPTINTLGHRVFNFCVALASITIPPTITTISSTLFGYCTNLTSITLPDSITIISDNAFFGCSSLVSIDLPSTIKTIGHWAFSDCRSLTSIELPEKLIAISNQAFQGCSGLTTITLRSSGDALVKTASFSTINFNSAGVSFREILIGAGFSLHNPDYIIYERPAEIQFQTIDPDEMMYYDIKQWARTRNVDSRLPLFTAAAKSMRWDDMETIYDNNMPAIYEVDALTGLSSFMLAAVGPTSDINCIYNLLKNNPVDFAHDFKRQARARNEDYRSPLCAAAVESMKWANMERIFHNHMPAIDEVDAITGLPLYMLAAIGLDSDIESVYNLLRENPARLISHADPR